MSEEIFADVADDEDILELLHGQGKRRDQQVPQFDVTKTARLVCAVRDLSTREASTENFWAALTPTEQSELVATAQKRTFPVGTALMHEGGQADSVMVILDGRTKVCVHEGGRERVIAERGPGDFIGERGRPPGGVRVATILATEPVLALVMTTRDYAVFVSEHFDVPDVVKRHVKDRLPVGTDCSGEGHHGPFGSKDEPGLARARGLGRDHG